jgi:transglutaminase-like putative cysteine protease
LPDEAQVLLNIRHETVYRYDEPVRQSVQSLRLTPRREHRQRALSWQMSAPGRRSEQLDAHGNIAHLLSVEEPHREIRIVVNGTVEIGDEGAQSRERGPLSPLVYLAPTPLTGADAAIGALAARCLPGGAATRDPLQRLAAAVCAAVAYQPGATTVSDSAATALQRGQGVCQDQTHVFLAACRAAHVPARYVSGYLLSGAGSDIASHAWVDVWQQDEGTWLGIDVTHASWVGAQHCRLAVGRDYLDAAPVRGVRRGGGHETLEVNVLVAADPVHSGQQ